MVPEKRTAGSPHERADNHLDGNWRKSRFSGPFNDACVEARCPVDGTVEVRNSRQPRGPVLSFTGAEWDAFVAGVKDGQFDRVLA